VLHVQHEAWREAFVPILPPGFMLPSPEAFRGQMAEGLGSSRFHTVVATVDGAVRGWISFGENRDADATAGMGEVRALFVHPASWRIGLGSALLSHALAELREMGYEKATVWSFADNARANAFYEGHGFERDGAEQRRPIFSGGLEVRYRRALA
jgi:GNAT superfamily N-acetyltransferase